jgi:hypothetical protein
MRRCEQRACLKLGRALLPDLPNSGRATPSCRLAGGAHETTWLLTCSDESRLMIKSVGQLCARLPPGRGGRAQRHRRLRFAGHLALQQFLAGLADAWDDRLDALQHSLGAMTATAP